MDIIFHCGKCGQRIAIDEEGAGLEAQCPKCGADERVPPKPPERKIRLKTGNISDPSQPPPSGPPCPHCHEPLQEPGAVICLRCGWNLKTGKPLKTKTRRGFTIPWRMVANVALLAVIAGACWHIWQQIKPAPTRRAFGPDGMPIARPLPEPVGESPDWPVVDWQISAQTDWWSTNAPKWATGQDRPMYGMGQAASTPAIRIRLQIEAGVDDQIPSLWPKAERLEVLRAAVSNGTFKAVQTLGRREVFQLVRSEQGVAFINGQRQPRRQFAALFFDPDVITGRPYYYKLRFLDRKKKLLAESGYCSTVALCTPTLAARVDQQGFPVVQWPALTVDQAPDVSDLKLLVGIPGTHTFATLPVTTTETKAPLKAAPQETLPLDISLVAKVRRDAWGMKSGQQSDQAEERLTRPVIWPRPITPKASRPPPPPPNRLPGGIFVIANPEDQRSDLGKFRVAVKLPGHVTILAATAVGADGAKRNLGNGREITESAGFGGRQAYEFIWPGYEPWPTSIQGSITNWVMSQTDDTYTARVSAVRAPLPLGLHARAGDGQVRLTWEKMPLVQEDWVSGPFVVIHRADESHLRLKDNQLEFLGGEEVGRVPATAMEFTDRTVRNDALHFYTMAIEGTTRATSWAEGAGNYECYLPVRVLSETAGMPKRVAAVPSKLRPLRVAVRTAPTTDPRANALQAQCFRALRARRWIELLERTAAASLLEEFQLTKLQSTQPPTTAPADVILEFRVRAVGYGANFDVWLDDYRNAQRQRLVSVPLDQAVPVDVTELLLKKLERQFPLAATAFPADAPPACAPIQTIAIAELRPLSPGSLTEDQMQILLLSTVAHDECVKIVEREKIRQALRELALTKLTDPASAVRLGKLVTADAILCGYYGVAGNQVQVSARLIDSGTGQIISVFELTGSADAPQTLCQQLGDQVLRAAKLGRPVTDSPLQRWMESQQYAAEPDRLAAAKTAVYVAPENVEHLYQLGQQQRGRGDYEEALASFDQGLAGAESREDPWRFYVAIDELLEVQRHPEKCVELWQRAVADRQRRQLNLPEALLSLARGHVALHHADQALEALRQIPKPGYSVGRLYERLGHTNEALSVYTGSFQVGGQRLGSSYAAYIRLMTALPVAAQKPFLQGLARTGPLIARRKAVQELLGRGETVDVSWLNSFVAGGAEPWLLTALEDAVRQHPNSLDALQAQTALAGIYRHRGQQDKARVLLDQIAASRVRGAAADELRERAAAMRQIPARAPQKESTALPRTSETGPRGDGASFVVTPEGAVCRVDDATRQVRWRYEMSPVSPYGTNPQASLTMRESSGTRYRTSDLRLLADTMVLKNGILLIADIVSGRLHAIDAGSGQARWTLSDWTLITNPVWLENAIHLGNSFGGLWKIDPATGRVLARAPAPLEMEPYFGEDYDQLAHFPEHRAVGFLHPIVRTSTTHDFTLPDLNVQLVMDRLLHNADYYAQRIGDASGNKLLDLVRMSQPLAPPHRTQPPPAAFDHQSLSASRPVVERLQAITRYSQDYGQAFLPELVEFTRDTTPTVRAAAVAAIGRLGDQRHLPLLKSLLGDAQGSVCDRAVEAIVRIAGVQARTELGAIADDPRSPLRLRVVSELVQAGDTSLIPLLKQIDSSRSYLQNDQLLVAFCRANDPDAIQELKQRFDFGGVPTLRPFETAVLVVRQMPERRFTGFVHDMFYRAQGRFCDVSSVLAQGLATIGDPSSIPALISRLPGYRGETEAFVRALEDLTGESFGGDRARWEFWWQHQAPPELKVTTEQPATQHLPGAPTKSIHIATTAGDLLRVKELLAEDPSLLESTSDGGGTGLTPLGMAVSSGHVEVTEFLLARGANIEISWWINGMTPLLLALHSGKVDVAKLLIQKGAKVNVRDRMGHTAFGYAVGGDHRELVSLLLEHGLDLKTRDDKDNTLLHIAAAAGARQIVELLVSQGADVNAVNKERLSPLAVARKNARRNVFEYLSQHGAKE